MRRQNANLSSLPLEVLVTFHRYYDFFYLGLGILTFIYKAVAVPFPRYVLGLEIFGIFGLFFVDISRSYIGSRGNKLQRGGTMLQFFLLSVACLVVYVYYLNWQTYVLRLDVIVYGIALGFVSLEIILSFFAMIVFWQNRGRFVT